MTIWTHRIEVNCPEEGEFTVFANNRMFTVLDEREEAAYTGEWGTESSSYDSLYDYLDSMKNPESGTVEINLLNVVLENK